MCCGLLIYPSTQECQANQSLCIQLWCFIDVVFETLQHALEYERQAAVWMQTEDCVEAHTNVDVVVNVNEFRALLKDRLPHVWAGKSVAEAAIPWPGV